MKRKTKLFLLAGVFCLLILFAALWIWNALPASERNQAKSERTIRVVMDDNYPPYVFRNAEGKLQGILIDEWKLWSKKTGTPVDLVAMDWADALDGMKNGEYDVIDTAFYSEERETWLDFSEPYATIQVPIYYNTELTGITGVSSLRGFTVGVKSGDSCIPILQRYGVSQIFEYTSYEKIVDAAKAGTLKEVFATGTAAVISPIGTLCYKGEDYAINNNEVGPLSQKLYDTLSGIQTGKLPDTRGWIERVS